MGDGGRKRSVQWAAQFRVAAELERHGYNVAFTMGNNTPIADLMVGHATSGDQFWVDVKGVWGQNAWMGKAKDVLWPTLFYILVSVGGQSAHDRFFVMTQGEFNDLVKQYAADHPNQKPVGGFDQRYAKRFEGCWDKLPGWADIDASNMRQNSRTIVA